MIVMLDEVPLLEGLAVFYRFSFTSLVQPKFSIVCHLGIFVYHGLQSESHCPSYSRDISATVSTFIRCIGHSAGIILFIDDLE